MRIFLSIAVIGLSALITSACAGPPPEYRTTATVKDIMDSVVDPNADFLFKAVSTVVTAK
jgi:hypothetical protein